MQIPEGFTFLLELSDEQLAERVSVRRDGYALVILQERQHQDKAYLRESDLHGRSLQSGAVEVRRRVWQRRKMLAALNRLFTTESIQQWCRATLADLV